MFLRINDFLLENKCDLKQNHKGEGDEISAMVFLDERENCFMHINIYSCVTYFGLSNCTLIIQLIKLINN